MGRDYSAGNITRPQIDGVRSGLHKAKEIRSQSPWSTYACCRVKACGRIPHRECSEQLSSSAAPRSRTTGPQQTTEMW